MTWFFGVCPFCGDLWSFEPSTINRAYFCCWEKCPSRGAGRRQVQLRHRLDWVDGIPGGQIIPRRETRRVVTLNGGLVRELPQNFRKIMENSGLGIIHILY